MKSAPSITFDFRPCRHSAAALVIAASLAVLAVALSGLPWWARGILGIGILLHAGIVLRSWLRTDITRIAWGDAGWRLIDDAGHEHPVTLREFLQRGILLVIEFVEASGRQRRFLLTPGNSDHDLRRRLLLVLIAHSPKRPVNAPLLDSES